MVFGASCIVFGVLCFSQSAFPEQVQVVNERHAYIRGENVTIQLKTDARELRCDVSGWLPERLRVKNGKTEYAVNTSLLHPGDYEIRAVPVGSSQEAGGPAVFPISIVAPPNAQRFPLRSWRVIPPDRMAWWAEHGITGFSLDTIEDPLKPAEARNFARVLDEAARYGMDVSMDLYPLLSRHWRGTEDARCLLPNGSRDPDRPYPLEPSVMEYARRTAESAIEPLGGYPALRGAFLQTEYETPFSMNEVTRKLAKQEIGVDLGEVLSPQWTNGHYMDPAKFPPAFQPQGGIISDDNPMYRFLRWWWERGHGTNFNNLAMAKEIRAKCPNILCWHDPYRLAPVYKSHLGLDCISTWTYGYPDIKRLVYTTAMQGAAKREQQKVMQTITLYVYGRFAVPLGNSTSNVSSDQAGADVSFNNGPDYTREAMWLVMSQRPDILTIYYEWHGDSVPPEDAAADLYKTSPESFDAVSEINRTLIEPFGPVILNSQRLKPNVAVLMSATAVWFHATPLWPGYPNEQILPFCELLMMNHVPFNVLLDDDIRDGKLKDYDVLVIPRGDTLAQSVYDQIKEFAHAGKTVIADGTLRAPVPEAKIANCDFAFEQSLDGRALAEGHAITAEDDRARMEAHADQLKPLLERADRPAQADSKRALINTLQSGDIRYVFVVNDERTYGPRFGEYKLMFETGLLQRTKVMIKAPEQAVLYDALRRRPIAYTRNHDDVEFPVMLDPARGKLIAVLPHSIGKVLLETPDQAKRGAPYDVRVRVLDASGSPLRGSLPLRVELSDPLGRTDPYSRYAATDAEGEFRLTVWPALNDLPGDWTLRVTDLLAGTKAERTIGLK
jgi:hypothetical protein